MSAGPRGFAFACFEGEEPFESEVPNIVLDVDKHEAAASDCKALHEAARGEKR